MTNDEHAPTRSLPRVRPRFAIMPSLRTTRLPRDTWHLRAASVVVSGLVPIVVLALVDRMDLVLYTLAGSMAALFTHALPYRQRASTMALFVLWLTLGCGAAMSVATLTDDTLIRIVVASVLAAVIRVAHDASKVGAPTPVIPIFLVTAMVFADVTWSELAFFVGLVFAAGVVSWLVVMAPGLLHPRGPERHAVATAVLAGNGVRADPASQTSRDQLATAVSNAWRTLELAGRATPDRDALGAHIIAAARLLHDPTVGSVEAAKRDARTIERSRGRMPAPPLSEAERDQLVGIRLEREEPHDVAGRRPIIAAFRPSSPSSPYFWRLLASGLAAALLSHLLGVGHPFWAITTAAVIVQPNLLLTWRKAPPRALGALLGVGMFALLVPIAHVDPFIAALMVLALNALAELFVPRNYTIGQLFVTPMALLITELGGSQPIGELVVDRLIDTVLGIVCAVVAAFLIRNRHLRRRAKACVDRLDATSAEAEHLPETASPAEVETMRRRLVARLADLAGAVRMVDAEWWTHRVDETRVVDAQARAHRALAELPGIRPRD